MIVLLNGKFLVVAMIPVLVLISVGCSGINTTQSISPATFFLPGLMKADPPSDHAQPEATEPPLENSVQS
jgi:hypothetical protein